MKTLIVIPARLASSRLPRKLLLRETGKPLIAHVIDQACKATVPDDILIVAPNGDFAEIWTAAGFSEHHSRERRWPKVANTGDHPNGTSRAAQAALFADQLDDRLDGWWEAYCIVQADEPEIDPALIDLVVSELEKHEEWDCATACGPLANMNWGDVCNESRVKAFIGGDGLATDFARRPASVNPRTYDKCGLHIGIYAYRRDALLRYAAAGPCEREQAESLEQLRALHIGLKMGVVLWDGEHFGGIDTAEDYADFVARYKAAQVS